MHPSDVLVSGPFAQALGWTLLHFVWQGGLVALLLALALRVLRRYAAPVRYAVACSALVLLLALPMITLGLLWPTSTAAPGMTAATSPSLPTQAEVTTLTTGAVSSEAPVSWQQAAYAMLGTALPWLVLIWITGVLALSMRYLAGWTYTLHLRRRGTREVGQRWHEQLARLKRQLGVTRPVRLVASALVHVPTVAGWLRPVILMPIGVFTGLTPHQVAMVLAHELAHIRRHDYLVNLMQAMCETLLFYHPAVWWISQRIRVEREHCCDDLVVAVCGDAFTYAEALAKMEQARQTAPRLALAATGGSLLDRIRRLLEGPAEAPPGAARWLAGLTIAVVLLLSLTLSPVLNHAWNRAHAWIAGSVTGETPHASQDEGRPFQHPLARGGYDDTALRLERLIFDDPRQSVQLEALDELRVLPKRTSLTPLINIAERHPRKRVRREAVQWLGRIGDAYVVYTLERIAFDDHSFSVRMEALDALRHLPKNVGMPSLMKIAQAHPRAAMRSEAVQWLGRIDGEAARLLLERILFEDPDTSVQEEAFDALKKLIDNPSTVNQIAETHPNEAVRRSARRWLERRRARQPRLEAQRRPQPDLVADLQHASEPYRDAAEKLERLVFEDEDPTVQREAFDALLNLPGPAIKPSLDRIIETHPDAALHEQATARLADVHQEEAFTALVSEALETIQNHPRADVRAAAVQPLRAWSSPKALRFLTDIAFDDASFEVRLAALDALRARGGLEAMARIARIARRHPDPAMRSEAVKSMNAMNADDRLPLLEEIVFQDAHLGVRMAALYQLKDAPETERAGRSLQKIAEAHPDERIRDEARQQRPLPAESAFDGERENENEREFDDEDDEDTYSWSQALSDLRHASARRRLKALDKVETMRSTDLLPTLADMAYEDPSLEVQLEILNLFRDRGDWDGDSWVLHIARNHPSARMRSEAVQSLDSQDGETIRPVLQYLVFNDASPAVQREALDWLIDLADERSRSILLDVARRHPAAALRRVAAEALEETAEEAPTQRTLIRKEVAQPRGRLNDDDDDDDFVAVLEERAFADASRSAQMEALDALRNLPYGDGLQALKRIARRHPRKTMRQEAVQWLGSLGDEGERALLEHIAFEDRSHTVQMEALDALRNLPRRAGVPGLKKIARSHPDRAMRQEAIEWLGRL